MTASPYCTIGPFFPAAFVEGCDDLTRFDGKTAQGRHIALTGRVLEEGGKPTKNTILEIWQADSNGVFRNPLDPGFANVDQGFCGWGRTSTDAEGYYRFLTVMPGAYRENDLWRCPHANLMILAIGLTRRLTTTVFFSDTPETVDDPVLNCIADTAARRRLFAVREGSNYRFDIVLRGHNETPFFLD